MLITLPDAPAVPAYLALGSNLGDRDSSLRGAIGRIGELPWTRVDAVSNFIETPAAAPEPQPPYLNAACRIMTPIALGMLAFLLHGIEQEFGRRRHAEVRWSARTLDIDLLMYGERSLDEPDLTIPHPRLAGRRFVLAPLAEVCPTPIPCWEATARELLERLDKASNARTWCEKDPSCASS